MFGTKNYKDRKQKNFKSDMDRKKFFAIKNYYRNKNNNKEIINIKNNKRNTK